MKIEIEIKGSKAIIRTGESILQVPLDGQFDTQMVAGPAPAKPKAKKGYGTRKKKELKIATIVSERGRATTVEVAEALSVSRPYANNLIAKLVKENKLIRNGNKRSTYYTIS